MKQYICHMACGFSDASRPISRRQAALNYQCLAYCSIVGRAERLPLLLKGPLATRVFLSCEVGQGLLLSP